MFTFEAAVTFAVAMYDAQSESHFCDFVKTLPIECQAEAIASYTAEREKRRLEAREDRKYVELCKAIRESGNRSSYSALVGTSDLGLGLGIIFGESLSD